MNSFFKNILKGFKDGYMESKNSSTNSTHDFKASRSNSKTDTYSFTPKEYPAKMLPKKDIYVDKEVQGIASNIAIYRSRKGWTQKQLAECLGYKSASFISRLELWETEKITYAQLEKISQCLDVDIAKLLHAKFWHDGQ